MASKRSVELSKVLKDKTQVFRFDSNPPINHVNADIVGIIRTCANENRTPFGAEFNGVVNEMFQNLPQPLVVGRDMLSVCRNVYGYLLLFSVCVYLIFFNGRLHRPSQVDYRRI